MLTGAILCMHTEIMALPCCLSTVSIAKLAFFRLYNVIWARCDSIPGLPHKTFAFFALWADRWKLSTSSAYYLTPALARMFWSWYIFCLYIRIYLICGESKSHLLTSIEGGIDIYRWFVSHDPRKQSGGGSRHRSKPNISDSSELRLGVLFLPALDYANSNWALRDYLQYIVPENKGREGKKRIWKKWIIREKQIRLFEKNRAFFSGHVRYNLVLSLHLMDETDNLLKISRCQSLINMQSFRNIN